MAIQFKNLVQVDLRAKAVNTLIGSYGITVLISTNAIENDKIYKSLEEVEEDYARGTSLYSAADTYFNNRGSELRIVKKGTSDSYIQVLERCGEGFIVFAVAEAITDADVVALNTYLQGLSAPNKKIFTVTDENKTLSDLLGKTPFVAGTYSSKNANADLAMAGYLSSLDLTKVDDIKGYMFTKINIEPESLSQSEYEELMNKSYNFAEVYNGQPVTAFGGTCFDGNEVVLNWSLIAIEKDIVEVVASYIIEEKPPMTDGSVTQIENKINGVLQRYVTNGLLTRNKVYNGESENYQVGTGEIFPLIQTGDVLTNGYVVYVLPISTLTPEEFDQRVAPPIFVYVAEAGQIKKVSIIGEVK